LESISTVINTPIPGAHFLLPDPDVRAEKFTTSVVVSVFPDDVGKFGESICLFSHPRKVPPALPQSSHNVKSAEYLGTHTHYAKQQNSPALSALSRTLGHNTNALINPVPRRDISP